MLYKHCHSNRVMCIVQELCESRGGRPELSVLTSLLVSVDVKLYSAMLRHWSQLVPNMSTDIWGHYASLHHHHHRVISNEWSQNLQQTWVWLLSVNGWVPAQYTIDRFADVSIREAYITSRSMSERRTRTLKDTSMIKYFLLQIWGSVFASYDSTLFVWFRRYKFVI